MFQLCSVLPQPLQSQIRAGSEIWRTDRQISANRRYFVSAASGKGKTTLQHILYGMRRDYEGEAIYTNPEGQAFSLQKMNLEQWATLRARDVAIVFQDLRLFPNLTARENLQLKNELTQHLNPTQIEDYCARLGVSDLLDRPAGLLSYGQRQRFAIIRALCQPFRTLLMDEPFSHLDTENIRLACALISEHCAAHKAGYLVASLGDHYFLDYDEKLAI